MIEVGPHELQQQMRMLPDLRQIAHLLDLYRQQRRLPAGPLAALVSRQTRTRIICRGELEHVLGLSKIIPRVRDAARRLGL
jgi:hypothetical protein